MLYHVRSSELHIIPLDSSYAPMAIEFEGLMSFEAPLFSSSEILIYSTIGDHILRLGLDPIECLSHSDYTFNNQKGSDKDRHYSISHMLALGERRYLALIRMETSPPVWRQHVYRLGLLDDIQGTAEVFYKFDGDTEVSIHVSMLLIGPHIVITLEDQIHVLEDSETVPQPITKVTLTLGKVKMHGTLGGTNVLARLDKSRAEKNLVVLNYMTGDVEHTFEALPNEN